MSIFGDVGVATRNGLKRMIEARQRQAEGYVNATLASLDDETLAQAGIDRAKVARKATCHYPL